MRGAVATDPWSVAADILDPPITDSRRPDQRPSESDWRVWLLHPGRGWGKGYAASHWIRDRVRSGEAHQIALVGATVQDVRRVMIEKPGSGILDVCPDAEYWASKAEVRWPGGVRAYIYSAEKPDRLRGPDHDHAWADECDSWGQQTTNAKARQTWDNLALSVRVGRAQTVVTSTPKPGRIVSELLERARDEGDVEVATGSTYDNADNLAASFIEAIERRYKGTRLERQEIYGEVLEEIHGALWTPSSFSYREIDAEELGRVVVGVDPSGGGEMIGIVVAGELQSVEDSYAVLDDWTLHGSPATWARRVVEAYQEWDADLVVAERNFGGDMVKSTIRSAGREVPVKVVTASRGKHVRAEPVALLYDQGRVYHRQGSGLDLLEDELRHFTTRGYEGEGSPNRADAAVWALSELYSANRPGAGFQPFRL